MASSMLLLLPVLFLFFLILVLPSHSILDPTSTTLAFLQARSFVCGITAGSQPHSVYCTRFRETETSNVSFPTYPTLSFDSVSGGENFICSLRSGDSSFLCWDGIGQRLKRIYNGSTSLSQLSVGARHVAGLDGDRTKIMWWRYGCDRRVKHCSDYPKSVSGEYYSFTWGDDFSCAINNKTRQVECWGPRAMPIQNWFSDRNMKSITAGADGMCGLNGYGILICVQERSNGPHGEPFEFTSLALGSSLTCAITTKNGSVVCWGQHGSFFPIGSTRFEFIVAGGDLYCGLTTDAFNVVCWRSNGGNSSAVIQALPTILPGVCVPDKNACICGVYQDSGNLCGGSGVICKKYEVGTLKSCEFYPDIPVNDDDRKIAFALFYVIVAVPALIVSQFACFHVGARIKARNLVYEGTLELLALPADAINSGMCFWFKRTLLSTKISIMQFIVFCSKYNMFQLCPE